jgi:hypothetical protein
MRICMQSQRSVDVQLRFPGQNILQRFQWFLHLYVLEIPDHEVQHVRARLRANPWWTWRAAVDSGTLGGVFDVFAGKPIWLNCVIASDKQRIAPAGAETSPVG